MIHDSEIDLGMVSSPFGFDDLPDAEIISPCAINACCLPTSGEARGPSQAFAGPAG